MRSAAVASRRALVSSTSADGRSGRGIPGVHQIDVALAAEELGALLRAPAACRR